MGAPEGNEDRVEVERGLGEQLGGWSVLSPEAANCRRSGSLLCCPSVILDLGSHI